MYSPGILQLHKPTLNLGSSTEFEGPWASYLTSVRLNIFGRLLCELKEVIGWSIEQSGCHHEHSGSGGHTYQLAVASNTGMPSSGLASADPSLKSHPQCASANLCILPSSLSHFSLFPGYVRFPPPQRLPSCVRWLACLSLVVLGAADDSDSYLLVTIMQYLVHSRYPNIGGVKDFKKKRNVQNTVPLLF